ncbi:MAG TPA: hypothetical protein VHE60_04355 [Pyrinomonadaceae bacterium]|nr:hypothetical protein [Pyrinomonadaceae bacterium]
MLNDLQPSPAIVKRPANIFARKHRGMLIDMLMFLVNVFLMRLLVRVFLDIYRQASAGDAIARFGLLLFYLALLVLPSLGAILKRWHFHQRIKQRGEAEAADSWLPFGCIFIPAIYLIVNMCITLGVALTFLDLFPGSQFGETVGVSLLLFGIVYNVFQTVLVFRYFAPPKREPKSAFLRDPRSESLGDACIFLNLILYQVLLNWVTVVYPGFHEGKATDRFFTVVIFALLIYITGRIFFLVEDLRHPRTWLTILLANSPLVVRVVLGGPATATAGFLIPALIAGKRKRFYIRQSRALNSLPR